MGFSRTNHRKYKTGEDTKSNSGGRNPESVILSMVVSAVKLSRENFNLAC